MPRDIYTNTVEDAAAFQAHYADRGRASRVDAADVGPSINRDEYDLFEVDATGDCTMCDGSGTMDNCPGMCSHENCSEWTCPQCEGEGSREIIKCEVCDSEEKENLIDDEGSWICQTCLDKEAAEEEKTPRNPSQNSL